MAIKSNIPLGKAINPAHDYDNNYTLRDARIAKGYSGKELGEMVSVCALSIYGYERLRCTPPKNIQEKLAEVLGKEVLELFPDDLEEYVRHTTEQRGNPKRVKKRLKLVHLKGKSWRNMRHRRYYVPNFEADICPEELQQGVEKLLSTLPDRTREFFKLSYGFYDREYTYEEIGSRYNVTGSYVGQEIRKINKK